MGYTFGSLEPPFFIGDCYFEFLHKEYSVYTEFTIINEKIYFKEPTLEPIPISSIQGVQVTELNKLLVTGSFYFNNQLVRQLKISVFPVSSVQTVLRLMKNQDEVQTGRITLTNGEAKRELPVNIKKLENRIEVIEPKSKKKIIVLDQSDPIYLSDNVLLIFNNEGYPYYLNFDEKIYFNLTDFNIQKGYYHSYCQLFGSFGPVRFKGQFVGIMLNKEDMFIFDDFYQLYSFRYDQLKISRRLKNGMVTFHFTTHDGLESYINFSKVPKDLEGLVKGDSSYSQNIVVLDYEPFLLTINENVTLHQSKELQLSFSSEEINSVEVINNQEGEDVIIQLHIPYLNPQKVELSCMESLTPYILGNFYKLKKLPLVKEASITSLYSSWTRQMNDFLLYHLFGQLVILKDGIEAIQEKKNISPNKKNEQILNFMYYAIIEQKRVLDRVAIHFPELLINEERRFMSIENSLLYEKMQKQLLVISNQVQRHLMEIEGSLNAVSFSIIPRKTFEKQVKAKTERSYVGAAILGGVGILTGGLGFAVGGGLMALRTYFANKESNQRQVVVEENEQNKIHFFVQKALDSFEHMMETMIPYYMNQVSKTYYSMSKKHSEMLPREANLEASKKVMFERLADFYVEKKLPLQSGSMLNKEMIVQQLMIPETNQEAMLIGSMKE